MVLLRARSFGMAITLALLAVSAHAADSLFSPIDANAVYQKALGTDAALNALLDNPSTASLELVKANADLLSLDTETLTLTLARGLEVRAHRVESYLNESGSLVWSGVIETPGSAFGGAFDFDAIDSVMLVENPKNGKITGNVHYQGEWYKIRPLHRAAHAIVGVAVGAMPPDHPEEFKSLPSYAMAGRGRRGGLGVGQPKVDTIIRVMVHYTPAAASASGDISGLIDLAVAETNQGYTNSGVAIDVVLATKAQITYTESGNFNTDLSRYRGTTDGYMDGIHTTRNSVTADVGVIIINNAQYCGLASSIGSTASSAFAAVYWDCATGYYSFGHEIGHLQSARHDPANDPTNTPYAYGHGYQYTGSPKWRTIMAYNCTGSGCPRLNYWSNPSKLYNGVPMGTTTRSDNARVLNTTRTTLAGFR